MKLISSISLSSMNTSSLLCIICEICLRILHFGDISNESIINNNFDIKNYNKYTFD